MIPRSLNAHTRERERLPDWCTNALLAITQGSRRWRRRRRRLDGLSGRPTGSFSQANKRSIPRSKAKLEITRKGEGCIRANAFYLFVRRCTWHELTTFCTGVCNLMRKQGCTSQKFLTLFADSGVRKHIKEN